MIKTSNSFRQAYGSPDKIIPILKKYGYNIAPIADISSTFGFVKWRDECNKHDLKPVFGVSLYVTENIHAKKPVTDLWSFYAIDEIASVNELLNLATKQFRYTPLLSYEQAQGAQGVIKVAGHRSSLNLMKPDTGLFIGVSDACSKGYLKQVTDGGFATVRGSNQRYPLPEDKQVWEVACGHNARGQSYPQHIESNLDFWFLEHCNAELKQASMLVPHKPMSLSDMCLAGAYERKIDIENSVYRERLDFELQTIADKKFEDYFFIVADLIQWAKKEMLVGPGRGSSAGSLVCYCLGITDVDPIKYDLLFSRFLDPNRTDWPDIDTDLSDRDAAIQYLENKYGLDRVAKLGALAKWQAKNTSNEVCKALLIPRYELNPVLDSIPTYAAGDKRNDTALTVALDGHRILKKYPELELAGKLSGTPSHMSTHAAGVLLTQEPISNYVAVDSRTNTAYCDLVEAEELGLLKLDSLGLKTLTVLDNGLKMAGLPRDHLLTLDLQDQKVFDVLNDGKFFGVFQFDGAALKGLTQKIKVTNFDDLAILSALGRPGASLGSDSWVKRRKKEENISYPHELLEPFLAETLGVLVYQEQAMSIARELAGFDWSKVAKFRKVIGKSQGTAEMSKYEEDFKTGLLSKTISQEIVDKLWNDILAYSGYAFNKCLAGSTKIRIASPNKYIKKDMAIKELYDMYEANPSRSVKQQGRKPGLVSLFPDGRGYKQKAVKIIKSGNKECWRFVFDDDSDVICTKEHKFLINGNWSPIGDAVIGDSFASLRAEKFKGILNGRGKGHAKGNEYEIIQKGFGKSTNNPSWVNGSTAYSNAFKAVCEKNNTSCEECGGKTSRMEIHHNDFNRGHDRPKDLSYLCVSCHKKAHYEKGRTKTWQKGMESFDKKLKAVEYWGFEETYDIEMPEHHNFLLSNGVVTHNSHSVAYGMISYWTCWMKAYYPLEFAASSLSMENDKDRQITFLRELAKEGIEYTPFDAENSTEKWRVSNGRLIGPLTLIRGVGPKMVQTILSCRARGEPLPERAEKLLANAVTEIDSLYAIEDGLENAGFKSKPYAKKCKKIENVIPDGQWQNDVYIAGLVKSIEILDENDEKRIQDRIRIPPIVGVSSFFPCSLANIGHSSLRIG